MPSIPPQRADDVIRALVETRARVRYGQALKWDPNQAGEIHGTMIVNGDGSVKSVVVDKQATTLTDPELIDCLTTALKASRRAPSDGVRTVKFGPSPSSGAITRSDVLRGVARNTRRVALAKCDRSECASLKDLRRSSVEVRGALDARFFFQLFLS
jgi:hypothetical protein